MTVTGEQVRRRLKEKYTSTEGKLELQALLRQGGQSIADASLETQAELAETRLNRWLDNYALAIPARAVAAYYSHDRAHFHFRERRSYDMLGNLTRHDAYVVLRRVRKGASFGRMSFHESLERPQFNRVAWEKRVFFKAIFQARPGALVGPMRINGVYFLFMVTRVIPPKQASLEQARKSIMKALAVERRVGFVTAWRRKWTALTSCVPNYVIQKCRQYHGQRAPEDPVEFN
jgi:hypothetical protein